MATRSTTGERAPQPLWSIPRIVCNRIIERVAIEFVIVNQVGPGHLRPDREDEGQSHSELQSLSSHRTFPLKFR